MAQYVTEYVKGRDGKIRKKEPAAKEPKAVEVRKEEEKNVKG